MKNINFTLLIAAITLLNTNIITAQISDYAPKSPGKCYAKCLIADQYETVTEHVLIKDTTYRLESSAPIYETIEETYEIRPATSRLEVIPAEYETISEQQMVAAPSRIVSTSIEVAPATTKWVRRKVENCLSDDTNDCMIWYLVEVSAKTELVVRHIFKCRTCSMATASGDKCCGVDPSTRLMTRTQKVLKTPASVREVPIPAIMGTLTRKVIKQPNSSEIEVPTGYKTISKQVLVREGFIVWREVICENNVTIAIIRTVQDALRSRGYAPEKADNVMGKQTKAALEKFQKDNGLPIGNLDFETLKALGL